MKKNILLDSEKYKVLVNFIDEPSAPSLFNLYLPIVGYKAIFIYNYLINIYRIYMLSNIKKDSISDLLNTLEISIDEFTSACSLLEATNLLQTYINKEQEKIIFVLEKPLDYDSFINNDNLVNVLNQKISNDDKNKLRYIFNTNIISTSYENISDNFDTIVNKNKELLLMSNDTYLFDKLNQEIFIRYGKKMILNNNNRNVLIKAFNNKILPFECLIGFVENALICSDDNICYVDEKKLVNQIEIYLENKNFKTIKRNYKIFNLNENLDTYKEVIMDYNSNNCENYLVSIIKDNISLETKKVFMFLKTKLNFSDAVINVLVDYCLVKNTGRIEPNYIYKIGTTINNIGLTKTEHVIKYLQHVGNYKKPNLNKIYEQEDNEVILTSDLIDW